MKRSDLPAVPPSSSLGSHPVESVVDAFLGAREEVAVAVEYGGDAGVTSASGYDLGRGVGGDPEADCGVAQVVRS